MKEEKTSPQAERDGEERSEEERCQRWMDGQIKTETAAVQQRTHIPLQEGDVKGNRFGSGALKGIRTKGESRRMEVEDSGCQDWRWDRVRSHFSSVIALSVSPPLSSLSNSDTSLMDTRFLEQ